MSFIKIKQGKNTEPVKLSYNDYGKGEPVILIHGWPMSKEMWEYQVAALVDSGLRVIAYDRRGFGQSSRPWDGYDYDTLADDLHELIDQLELKNVTLVGFSMGGGEVVRYCSRYGTDKLAKVVLVSSVTPYMLKSDSNPDGVPQEVFKGMMTKMKEDRIGFLDEFGKTFFGVTMYHNPLSTPLLEYYRMLCSVASPRATLECAKSFASTDFRADMDSIDVPTLIIHGDADQTVPIKPTGDELAKALPDAQYIVYQGAAHGIFYTEREKLNSHLLAFIHLGEAAAIETPAFSHHGEE